MIEPGQTSFRIRVKFGRIAWRSELSNGKRGKGKNVRRLRVRLASIPSDSSQRKSSQAWSAKLSRRRRVNGKQRGRFSKRSVRLGGGNFWRTTGFWRKTCARSQNAQFLKTSALTSTLPWSNPMTDPNEEPKPATMSEALIYEAENHKETKMENDSLPEVWGAGGPSFCEVKMDEARLHRPAPALLSDGSPDFNRWYYLKAEATAYMDQLEADLKAVTEEKDDLKQLAEERERHDKQVMDGMLNNMDGEIATLTTEEIIQAREYSETCRCQPCQWTRSLLSYKARTELAESTLSSEREAHARKMQTVKDAGYRLYEDKYRAWFDSGGPNECPHGYCRGIPCRSCDIALVSAQSNTTDPTQ